MGVRMLHHRPAPARPGVGGPVRGRLPQVPALALGASTARAPATLAPAVCRARHGLGRGSAHRKPAAPGGAPGKTPAWRLWAAPAHGWLAPALTLLPRPRPDRTTTTPFIATADPVGARPAGPSGTDAGPGRDERPPHP